MCWFVLVGFVVDDVKEAKKEEVLLDEGHPAPGLGE
jgi:hypothetical protein